MSDIEEEEEGN